MINNISSNFNKIRKVNFHNLKFNWFDYIDIYLQVAVVDEVEVFALLKYFKTSGITIAAAINKTPNPIPRAISQTRRCGLYANQSIEIN